MRKSQNRNYLFDRMRHVVASVQHKHQFAVAMRYVQRTAVTTGDEAATVTHLNTALRMHEKLVFKPMPPAIDQYCPGGAVVPKYNLDPDYLTEMLWCDELNGL